MSDRGHVCQRSDLDLLLDEGLRREFQSVFYDFDQEGNRTPRSDSWRLFRGTAPERVLGGLGVDFERPTVRDAVALGLVKLDDPSVSNEFHYVLRTHRASEVSCASPSELERLLLNRNHRLNLPRMEGLNRKVRCSYVLGGTPRVCEEISAAYLGVRLSDHLLDYVGLVLDQAFSEAGRPVRPFVPSSRDVQVLTALVPNTDPDLAPTVFRSRFDQEWVEWKARLAQRNIYGISTYALVDPTRQKLHTGRFLAMAVRELDDGYGCVELELDAGPGGNPLVVVEPPFRSGFNPLLAVCESDHRLAHSGRPSDPGVWTSVEGEVSIPTSTTSARISVFRQAIPDEELRYVRNYVQFQTRLEGMELFQGWLESDLDAMKCRLGVCLQGLQRSIVRLFDEFLSKGDRLAQIQELYETISRHSDVSQRLSLVRKSLEGRKGDLERLQAEYAALPNTKVDRKLVLADRIATLRLDLENGLGKSLDLLEQDLATVEEEGRRLHGELCGPDDDGQDWTRLSDSVLDLQRLRRLVDESRTWNLWFWAMAWEAWAYQRLTAEGSDQCVRVRRLLKNFRDRISQTEAQCWDP